MSQRLPVVKPKEIFRALQRAGFFIHHSGSHHILKHPDKPELRVTVAVHGKDLKRKTLAARGRSPDTLNACPTVANC